jgi:predicted Zn-dependent protease
MRPLPVRAVFVALLAASGCAVNPATGERQLSLVGEGQEIQMGREADVEISASLGLMDDEGWQTYVQSLGDRMALASERPNLPWTFRVVDDHIVNAFALPGGFIYITRGILTHFSSEAELMGVLGHEIGHVTARHSVNQMSRAQLAQLGLGVGSILAPDLAPLAQAAGAGLGLLFLRYGRDDERQADDLGLRYMTREGYDPLEMAATFEMLADASGAREEGGRVPAFLSTHPDPLERRDRIIARVEAGQVSGTRVERESYLRRLEGMPFGEDPRQGYFEENAFFHPELAFRLDFPVGWQTLNGRDAVQGVSAEEDALLVLTLDDASTPGAARDAFLGEEGIQGGNLSSQAVNGLPAARADFLATTEQGTLAGAVVFILHAGSVYRILGYAPEARWSARSSAVRGALGSFRRVTDPAVLNRQADEIELVRTTAGMTVEEFHRRYPSEVPIETVATINHLELGETIPSGTLVKRVVSGSP